MLHLVHRLRVHQRPQHRPEDRVPMPSAERRPPLRLPHTRNPSLSRSRDRIKCSTLLHLECGGLPPLLQSQPNHARATCNSPRGSAAPAARHKLAQPVRAGHTTTQIGSPVGAPPNYARTTCDSPRGSAAPVARHKLAQPVRAGKTTTQIGSAVGAPPNHARTTCNSPRGSAAPAARHKLAQPVRAGNTTTQIGSAVGAPLHLRHTRVPAEPLQRKSLLAQHRPSFTSFTSFTSSTSSTSEPSLFLLLHHHTKTHR